METILIDKALTNIFSLKYRLIRQALIINIFIILLYISAKYNEMVALVGGMFLVLYFSAKGLITPVKTFFLVFGIKLTFDSLWFVRIPLYEEYGMLHLLLIPILIVVLFGPKISRHSPRWPIWCAFIYIFWASMAMASNYYGFDVELFIRQAGIIIGLLGGYKYLRNPQDFNTVAYLIFISTVVPILASIIQIYLGPDSPLFHYKLDTLRDYRYSGLYYDPATAGMVYILSLGSNLYLLYTGAVKKKYVKYHLAFIPLSLFVIFSGGTRSIIITSAFITSIYLIRNLKKSLIIIPLVLIVIFFSQSYIEKAVKRTTYEIRQPIDISQVLHETDYRPMFTGRVGMWQDLYEKFKAGTALQQLFGSGLSSNAHSSYFFLLLQIGYLGLLFYMFFHAFLFLTILKRKIVKTQKIIALLALSSMLLIGFSASTVVYTSFQWIIYLIVGGVLNLGSVKELEKT